MEKRKAAAQAKPSTAKTAKNTENSAATQWNTIHIFGRGIAQLINSSENYKADQSNLKSLDNVIDMLAAHQQKGTKVDKADIHAINIFNKAFIDYIPASAKSKPQRFEWDLIDEAKIEKLAKDIIQHALPVQDTPILFKTELKKSTAAKAKTTPAKPRKTASAGK